MSDRRAGAFVAQALGDALGFLVEGHHPAVCAPFIREAFASHEPPTHSRGGFGFGQYSDDTQLARELALSLLQCPSWAPEDFAARVAALVGSNRIVGRGRATEAAAMRLCAGTHWTQAGEAPPSAGNGAAMRAAPIGLHFADPAERLRVADEQARVTHLDPRARAAAVLVADVVAAAIAQRRDTPFEELAQRVQGLDPVLAAGVRRMPEWLAKDPESASGEIARAGEVAPELERWHGISPFATPSTLYAMYAYARSPDDPEQVLTTAIAAGGDVDTVAAMAGAMVGARVGWSGLGARLQRWAERLTDRGTFGLEELVALAVALGTGPELE